jgi:hypothetical protein
MSHFGLGPCCMQLRRARASGASSQSAAREAPLAAERSAAALILGRRNSAMSAVPSLRFRPVACGSLAGLRWVR